MLHRTLLSALLLACPLPVLAAEDPLPSWHEGATKAAILDFVTATTTEGSPDFIPLAERIATFDNDGTLWTETPLYSQLFFVLDRIRAMAPDHPEWATTQPFKAVLDGDLEALAASGEEGIVALMAVTHAGMTSAAFTAIVEDWIATARHPGFGKPYTSLTYQPMQEVLDYLRNNGFQNWIVSGGGIDFMRPWTETVYGIPPDRVIGSQIDLTYQEGGQFLRQAGVHFNDDKADKPVGILRHIGRAPVIAFGNSDGDFAMLDYATSSEKRRLGVLIYHTDAAREAAYDRESPVGRLDRALTEAPARGWLVVDMKSDWATVFGSQK